MRTLHLTSTKLTVFFILFLNSQVCFQFLSSVLLSFWNALAFLHTFSFFLCTKKSNNILAQMSTSHFPHPENLIVCLLDLSDFFCPPSIILPAVYSQMCLALPSYFESFFSGKDHVTLISIPQCSGQSWYLVCTHQLFYGGFSIWRVHLHFLKFYLQTLPSSYNEYWRKKFL